MATSKTETRRDKILGVLNGTPKLPHVIREEAGIDTAIFPLLRKLAEVGLAVRTDDGWAATTPKPAKAKAKKAKKTAAQAAQAAPADSGS